MSVTGISDGTSVYDLFQLYALQSTGNTSAGECESAVAREGSTDSVSFSKPGQLFSQLQQLAQTDPDKFKEVCQKIADKLNEAAQNEEGGANRMLSDLASRFESAAQSGDASELRPPPPPPPPPSTGSAQDVSDLYSQNQSTSLNGIIQGMFGESEQSVSIPDIILAALEEAGISVSS